ncbi:MAG TPA: TetR family transcriptional regulator [Candidatus Nanopelagicales bacterium]
MSDDPREALAAVARDILAKRGYVGLTMKTAAAAAGVTPEVAKRYYRNREALFAAALRLPMDPATAIPTLVAPGIEGMGERLVRYTLDVLKDGDTRAELVSLARTGVNAGHAVFGLQDFLETAIVDRMASMIGVPDARMRSALITSYLLGVAMMRYGVRLEPLASASEEEVIRMVAPVIQDLLDPRKPLPGSSRPRTSGAGAPAADAARAGGPASEPRRTASAPSRQGGAAGTTARPAPTRQEVPAPRTFDPDPKATAARRAAEQAHAAADALGKDGDHGQPRTGARSTGASAPSRATSSRSPSSRSSTSGLHAPDSRTSTGATTTAGAPRTAATSAPTRATPASTAKPADRPPATSRGKPGPRTRPDSRTKPDAGTQLAPAAAAEADTEAPNSRPRHAARGDDAPGSGAGADT